MKIIEKFVSLVKQSKDKGSDMTPPQGLEVNTNRLFLIENGVKRRVETFNIPGLSFDIKGLNNTVTIELPIKFSESCLTIDSNDVDVHIESCNTWGLNRCGIRIAYGGGQVLRIGRDTTCVGLTLNLDGSSCCYIGRDCMFGGDVLLLPSDGHSIIDPETLDLLNSDGEITIGDHVWIGARSIICKNTNISSGCVVAAGSVVPKMNVGKNSIIAGAPAKVLRTGKTWHRCNPYFYKSEG